MAYFSLHLLNVCSCTLYNDHQSSLFCREPLLWISQTCKTSRSLMSRPSTRENPWTKSSAVSGNSKHLESILKCWGAQTGRRQWDFHGLYTFSFFWPSEPAEAVRYFNWSSCFSTASARLLMPDFPAKWQLVSPRTGSCYQPESTARLINLIDLHWLENKLFEQLCLSDPISWPKSQKKHPQFVRPVRKRVCTCVLILGICEGKPKNVVHWSFISFFKAFGS